MFMLVNPLSVWSHFNVYYTYFGFIVTFKGFKMKPEKLTPGLSTTSFLPQM